MDLETENRIAAILLKEAAELRRQTEKEGVLAYLRQPRIRSRPNSRFVSATLLGVQQANRTGEINSLWRLRQKQLDLEDRIRNNGAREGSGKFVGGSRQSNEVNTSQTRTSQGECTFEDEGLRDEELEEFLLSRAKRGRGAVGPRMDEAGPYPCSHTHTTTEEDLYGGGRGKERRVYGPERPLSLTSSSEESKSDSGKRRRNKMKSSKRWHSGKRHKSMEKLRKNKKRKREHEKFEGIHGRWC